MENDFIPSCLRLSGDDAKASAIGHTLTGGRWGLPVLQWPIQI